MKWIKIFNKTAIKIKAIGKAKKKKWSEICGLGMYGRSWGTKYLTIELVFKFVIEETFSYMDDTLAGYAACLKDSTMKI